MTVTHPANIRFVDQNFDFYFIEPHHFCDWLIDADLISGLYMGFGNHSVNRRFNINGGHHRLIIRLLDIVIQPRLVKLLFGNRARIVEVFHALKIQFGILIIGGSLHVAQIGIADAFGIQHRNGVMAGHPAAHPHLQGNYFLGNFGAHLGLRKPFNRSGEGFLINNIAPFNGSHLYRHPEFLLKRLIGIEHLWIIKLVDAERQYCAHQHHK